MQIIIAYEQGPKLFPEMKVLNDGIIICDEKAIFLSFPAQICPMIITVDFYPLCYIQLVITTEPFDYWAFRHSRGLLPTVYLSVWLGCADRQPGLSAGLLAGNRLALLPEIWLLPENRHGNERKKAVRREEGFL